MGTFTKTSACALLVVFICAVSSVQSQFSANTTGKSDKVGWSGGDPESTSAYGIPQVPSKMTKHKKSEQVSPDDVPIVNKSALPRFDIVPFRHDGESINSCMSTVNSTVRASEALTTRKVRENF